jgi:hypothetical protein
VAFVEAAGAGVGGEDAEDEAAEALAAGALDRGVEETGGDPLPLALRGDREAADFGQVGGRLERQPWTEDQVADDLLAVGRDEDVLDPEAVEERPLGIGRRRGADPGRPGPDIKPAEARLVAILRAADQENFCGSSRQ